MAGNFGTNGEALTVNRYLKDKRMDHIDHALGRPVDPFCESYRNYFAIDSNSDLANQFRASPNWQENKAAVPGDMAFFSVTKMGRMHLSEHLDAIGDKHRTFEICWDGCTFHHISTTHSKARYSAWLRVSDMNDIPFGEFVKTASVRVAS